MTSTRVIAATLLLSAVPVVASAKEIVLAVPGIPGPYCAYGVEKRLLEVEGIIEVRTMWTREEILIVTNDEAAITAERIDQAVKQADYPYSYEIKTGQ